MAKASKVVKDIIVEQSDLYQNLLKENERLKKNYTPDGILKSDMKEQTLKEDIGHTRKQYKMAMDTISNLTRALDNLTEFNKADSKPFEIKYHKHGKLDTEAVAMSILSDIHAEEKVESKSVNGLNEFNLEICKQRIESYFKGLLRLIEIERNGVIINELIINFLGDAINGYIHDEYLKSNLLSPVQAIVFVQDLLISGINYLKKNGKFQKITLICMEGNHGRTTKKQEVATSYMNSYEWLLYQVLAKHYEKDAIVKFVIPESILYYYTVFGKVIRTLHGGEIKYSGGVGGIEIPVKKAIAQWDKSTKADITLFGHYHTFATGQNFVANSSVVGWNAYAISIKAEYALASQVFFLIDNKRGRTLTTPIFLQDAPK